MTMGLKHIVAGTALAAMVAVPVLAEKADQLLFLNGRSAAEAERQLEARGFRHESSHDSYSNGYINSYWWHRGNKNCIRIEAYDGGVVSVADVSKKDCGHSGGSDVGTALGVAAGAAILGALLSHKSHHHEDNRHHDDTEDEAHYERGYKDGLYNAPYHNYDRSNAYSDGYSAGVDERNANLRHHYGHGGYRQNARFKDLQGARARTGMSELENRGFRQVDNFTSGNTRYSIQWRAGSRQCVQVTIADGRFYDLRDIGRHPNCR